MRPRNPLGRINFSPFDSGGIRNARQLGLIELGFSKGESSIFDVRQGWKVRGVFHGVSYENFQRPMQMPIGMADR